MSDEGRVRAPGGRLLSGVGRGRRRTMAVLLGVALVAVAVMAVTGLSALLSVGSTLTAPAVPVPATIGTRLVPGTYLVYERVGSVGGVGPVTVRTGSGPTIDPQDVTVSAPGGARVPARLPAGTWTVERGGDRFVGVAEFSVAADGTYRVDVAGESGQVLVDRRLFDGQGRSLAVLLGAAAVAGVAVLALFAVWVTARPARPT